MAQKVLPYEYEIEDGKSGLTSVGGLPTYLDLASATGLVRSIDRHLKIRTGDQGWTDRQIWKRMKVFAAYCVRQKYRG